MQANIIVMTGEEIVNKYEIVHWVGNERKLFLDDQYAVIDSPPWLFTSDRVPTCIIDEFLSWL